MFNSPGATRATIIHDVTEDTNLQDSVATGSITVSDIRVGQTSLKTTMRSAAEGPGTQSRVAQIFDYRYRDAISWRRRWPRRQACGRADEPSSIAAVPTLGHKPERLSPIHDRLRALYRPREPQRIT
jgi:hypothetical protein